MPQKTFTPEEIQGLKATSAKSHDGRFIAVDLDPPIDATVAVASLNRAEYATFYDRSARDAQTAYHGTLLDQLLYPGFAEIEALRQEWPAMPEDVIDQLLEEAGASAEERRIRLLDLGALPIGLEAAGAAKLVEEAKGRKLWCVEQPGQGLSCVMRAPLADVWLAAKTAHGDALRAKKGIIDAIDPYVLGAVAWSSGPLTGGTGLLDRKPVLIWALWEAFKRTGGHGVAVRRKSF